MDTVVYLDTVLFYNTLADYLLLLAAGRLAGLPLRRRYIFVASVLGGVYAVAAAIPSAAILRCWWLNLPLAALMVRIAYGRTPGFLRRYLLFLLVSGGFAGVELALYSFSGSAGGVPRFSLLLFLGSFVLCWLLLGIVFRGSAAPAAVGQLVHVAVTRGDRSVRLTALWDSGCALRDPVNGDAVAVVEFAALSDLFSAEERDALLHHRSTAALPLMSLPFCSIGGSGLLTAFRADCVRVGGRECGPSLVAVYPGSLGGELFHALWGGEERER